VLIKGHALRTPQIVLAHSGIEREFRLRVWYGISRAKGDPREPLIRVHGGYVNGRAGFRRRFYRRTCARASCRSRNRSRSRRCHRRRRRCGRCRLLASSRSNIFFSQIET